MKSYVFPGEIEKDIRDIASQPIPYMRTAEFSEVVRECGRIMLGLAGCPGGKVIPYTASGTAAMDAVAANYVAAKGKAFVISGGSFGQRWAELCSYYKIEHTVYKVPFAKDIDYKSLENEVACYRPSVFLCQHHETSTGQLFNLEKISEICHKYGVSLVVDCISSFLSEPLSMETMGIDITLTSSQKGLNISPGLSFIMLSERVQDYSFRHGSYYLDFQENLKNLERGQTPFSPATTLFLQLHARLIKLEREGVTAHIGKVRERALYFRQLCKEHGWEVPAEVPANCITGFFLKLKGASLFREMIKRGYYIMPGGTSDYYRVSHLGEQSMEDLDELVMNLKTVEEIYG